MIFRETLIPCSRFPRVSKYYTYSRFSKDQTDLQDVSVHVFSNIFKISDLQQTDISSFCLRYFLIFAWISWSHLVYPKLKRICFLGPWTRPLNPRTMKMIVFRTFLKWNQKVTSPKWSRIILRSFWPILFVEFIVQMVPQTPQTPNLDFSPDFPGFSIGIL